MVVLHGGSKRADVPGFTLAEVMIAVGVLSLFMVVCFTSIVQNRALNHKSREEAIAMDFLVHYVESIKGLPFEEVSPGQPIGTLFNGQGGAPNIRIPANGSPVSLTTPDYQTFHPDLIWLANRNPQLRVKMTAQSASVLHLLASVEWDAPLGRGGRMHEELDLVRVMDL